MWGKSTAYFINYPPAKYFPIWEISIKIHTLPIISKRDLILAHILFSLVRRLDIAYGYIECCAISGFARCE